MFRYICRLSAVIIVGFALAGTAEAAVSSCSRTEASGERTLCHEAVIAAPVGQVWELWATSEGLASWAAPIVAMDARSGGTFESNYDPNGRIGAAGNIRNRVIAAVPNALLVIQVSHAPPGFAHEAEVQQLATAITLEAIDADHTRVRVAMIGYREGAAFDELYQFFDRGNAWTLSKLEQRVTSGPVDWRAEAGAR